MTTAAASTNVLFGSRPGGLNAEHFSMWTRKLDDIKPGEERTWTYVLAAHPGQWHWGADRYREWFHQTHGPAQPIAPVAAPFAAMGQLADFRARYRHCLWHLVVHYAWGE